jgi:hypothetical protein
VKSGDVKIKTFFVAITPHFLFSRGTFKKRFWRFKKKGRQQQNGFPEKSQRWEPVS